jgi:cytochrome c-type biogenesis protein CcmE
LCYGLIAGLAIAPPDYQQGEAFRMIYVLVPSALLSLTVYTVMAAASAVALIWRIKVGHAVASAAAPIGASFTILALFTGSLWGRPMWGTYWAGSAAHVRTHSLISVRGVCRCVRRSRTRRAVIGRSITGDRRDQRAHRALLRRLVELAASRSNIVKLGAPSMPGSMLWCYVHVAVSCCFCRGAVFDCGAGAERERQSTWVTGGQSHDEQRAALVHGRRLPRALCTALLCIRILVLGWNLWSARLSSTQRLRAGVSYDGGNRSRLRSASGARGARDSGRCRRGVARRRASRENIMFYYDPSQVVAGKAPVAKRFRIGGMVVKGSVARKPGDLEVRFVLTDFAHEVPVEYTGVLPDLFREGQGIIAHGTMNANGAFVADVLAKHDEKYMPPEVAASLKNKTARSPAGSGPIT